MAIKWTIETVNRNIKAEAEVAVLLAQQSAESRLPWSIITTV